MDCGSEMRDRRRRSTLSLDDTILLLFNLDIVKSNRHKRPHKKKTIELLQLKLYIGKIRQMVKRVVIVIDRGDVAMKNKNDPRNDTRYPKSSYHCRWYIGSCAHLF